MCRFSTSSTCKTNKLVNAVEAYLLLHQGKEAAGEFQKFIELPPLGALGVPWLGRAYAIQGDSAKAQAAYQGFFTWRKDADPEIPSF